MFFFSSIVTSTKCWSCVFALVLFLASINVLLWWLFFHFLLLVVLIFYLCFFCFLYMENWKEGRIITFNQQASTKFAYGMAAAMNERDLEIKVIRQQT